MYKSRDTAMRNVEDWILCRTAAAVEMLKKELLA